MDSMSRVRRDFRQRSEHRRQLPPWPSRCLPSLPHLQATTALEVAQAFHQRGDEAAARWLLGLTTPSLVEAERFLSGALSLGSELAMRPLVAHCHLGLGKLYRRSEKREQASEHLTIAATMYREMGMTGWLERVEAQLKDLP